MAEIRKHDPEAGEGIARLVRQQLGETIRPVNPGESATAPPAEADGDEDEDDFGFTRLPHWDQDGPTFQF